MIKRVFACVYQRAQVFAFLRDLLPFGEASCNARAFLVACNAEEIALGVFSLGGFLAG